MALSRGDLAKAERFHQESLEIDREMGNKKGQVVSLEKLATIAMMQENYDLAERLFRDCVRMANSAGIPAGPWYVKNGYTDPDADWDFPPDEVSKDE